MKISIKSVLLETKIIQSLPDKSTTRNMKVTRRLDLKEKIILLINTNLEQITIDQLLLINSTGRHCYSCRRRRRCCRFLRLQQGLQAQLWPWIRLLCKIILHVFTTSILSYNINFQLAFNRLPLTTNSTGPLRTITLTWTTASTRLVMATTPRATSGLTIPVTITNPLDTWNSTTTSTLNPTDTDTTTRATRLLIKQVLPHRYIQSWWFLYIHKRQKIYIYKDDEINKMS